MQGKLSRRKFAAGIGSIGAVGVGAYTLTGTSQAAEVSIDGLSIPDKDKLVRSDVEDVRIDTTIQYSYESNTVPEKLSISLYVGNHPDDLYAVAMWENETVELKSNSGEQRIQGSILNTPTYSLEKFQTGVGETKTANMMVAVEFRVIANGKVQSVASEEDTSQLNIEDGEIAVSNSVGGTGNVTVKTAE